MTSSSVVRNLERVLGPGATLVPEDERVRVAPEAETECVAIMRAATRNGWKVFVSSNGEPPRPDNPARIVLSTERMTRLTEVKPADLFATAEAGINLSELQHDLSRSNMWLASQPPGRDRTLGGALSIGASGPLQSGFGPLRDQVLGLTVVTPTGRTVVGGGRVVKNVAGYDIPKLIIGGFGAFGIITTVHLRLRVTPAADVTMTTTADQVGALRLKNAVERSPVGPAALELRWSATGAWTVAVRLLGAADAVARGVEHVERQGVDWSRLDAGQATDYWRAPQFAGEGSPVVLRLGPTHASVPATIDRLRDHLTGGCAVLSGFRNTIRWVGDADGHALRELRVHAAQLGVPITIERAPWPLLAASGHFGELRTGVERLVTSLRAVFDPRGIMVAPLLPQTTPER